MFFELQQIILGPYAAESLCSDHDWDGGGVAESPPQYRPRHPEASAFYQLFETCFDSYVRAYEERFEAHSGPLRPVVVQLFRRLLLLRLHKAERLSQSFMQNLLSWAHPGFSVFAGPPVEAVEIAALESQARYITRPVLAMDALRKLDGGSLVLETPPDPKTGATSIELDPLEWIHRIASHIPDPGRHCQRFYGAYSNRGRIPLAAPDDETAGLPAAGLSERDNSDVSREARSTWARLIKKIFEADPLLCSCGARMRIVSFITDPRVVDRILRHRESKRSKAQDPFESRAPPGVVADSLQ